MRGVPVPLGKRDAAAAAVLKKRYKKKKKMAGAGKRGVLENDRAEGGKVRGQSAATNEIRGKF